MDSKRPEHIEKLLEKYWKCESTLEEEQELKEWFSHKGGSGSFKEEEALFQYFALEKKKELHSELTFEDEAATRTINSYKSKRGIKNIFINPGFKNISRIAAGIVVALAAAFFILQEKEPTVPAVFTTDTFDSPEEAYQETLKVLNLISQKLNVGKQQAAKISVLKEAEEQVKESDAVN